MESQTESNEPEVAGLAEGEIHGPRTPLREFASTLSDRAIQRVVGGNAFLRGRIYARRGAIEEFDGRSDSATAKISVRNVDEPYRMEVQLDPEHKVVSKCSCQAWRGPTGHCKHVAALLVALRDRERPPRRKDTEGESSSAGQGRGGQKRSGGSAGAKSNGAAARVKGTVEVVGSHGTTSMTVVGGTATAGASGVVTPGGKRRRTRRRRKGDSTKMEVGTTASKDRSGWDAWLGAEAHLKAYAFDYRLAVRAASIAVTPVLAGTRSAVPIGDALSSSNTVPASERSVFRALSRHAPRGQATVAELRGEEAAELIGALRNRSVLLEPASMHLRFMDEPLRPSLELDTVQGDSVRVRVMFSSGSRRFSLSQGAWFEGTPGWHIDTSEGIARPLAEAVTPAWLQHLYRSPALVMPIADLPGLLTEFLPRVATSLGAELPSLSSVAEVVDARPYFAIKATGDIVGAQVRVMVTYAESEFPVPVDGVPVPLAFFPPEQDGELPRVVRRDVGAEMGAVQLLMNLGLEVSESGEELVAQGDGAVAFWTDGLGELPEDWDRYIPDDLVGVTIRNDTVTPQMRVSSGVDWLNLDMTFDAGGVAVDENELRECLEKNRRLVKLEDGTYAPIEQAQVAEAMSRMAELVASAGEKKKLPLSQAGRVQDLLSLVDRAAVTPKAKALFQKLEDVGDIPTVPKPRKLQATLRDYQKKGFNWLVFVHQLGSGGILADDMGLGKTVQTIALMLWAKSKAKAHALNVVVAPTSVVPNWQREIEKFAPSLTTVMWQGPQRFDLEDEVAEADVLITSYALLRRDEEFLSKLGIRYVILDEAQHIKNPSSATAKAAKKLSSERRLALTGTPIENRLSEFWSIIDFVSPGLLGSLKSFEEKYARPIDRGDDKAAERLRKIIQPFVLRRTKSEVAPELPEKIEQEMVVPLEEEQSKLYQQITRETRKSVLSEVEKKGISKSQIQILAALTRLRQVACDPRLMKLPGKEWGDEESGKLSALREIVQEAASGGHRVLIFSQFVEMLKIIRNAMEEDGIAYEYLDGSTKDRSERVDRFNSDESLTVFLISLKAGGTGLNLTGADTVVHFDPWWNPAVEDQATDRAHRIGQTKVVSVYRLIARGTVEEKILKLSEKKRSLVSNVLSSEGAPLKGLTKSDLDSLFS